MPVNTDLPNKERIANPGPKPPGWHGRISAALVWDGTDEVRILSSMGVPRDDQMKGTAAERLSELCGRCCYDSLGKGRASSEYHKHILDVGHLSTIEHWNATIEFTYVPQARDESHKSHNPLLYGWVQSLFCNKPGIWVSDMPTGANMGMNRPFRVTMNLRAIREWFKTGSHQGEIPRRIVGRAILDAVQPLAPAILSGLVGPQWDHVGFHATATAHVVEPQTDEERWVTIYLTGSRGYCYDAETEVLTDEGWKKWPDVRGDEKFATLDMQTEEMTFQVASDVIREHYHGKMYSVASQCVDLNVTPNHRMLVRKHDTQAAKRGEEPLRVFTAEEIEGKRVKYKRNARWVGETPTWFEIPDVEIEAAVVNQLGPQGTRTVTCAGRKIKALAFARFLGYWLAEGHLDHHEGAGYNTVLSQNRGGKAWRGMHECLEELGFTFSEREINGCMQIRVNGGKALYEFLAPYRGSENKAIPPQVKGWGPEYHEALITAYLEGDGSNSGGRHAGEGHTVSKRLADDLQEAALKAGWSATIRAVDRRDEPAREGKWAAIKSKRIIYVVGFAKHRGQEPLVNHGGKKHDSWKHYRGMVYCVTVPNGTLYVRRNGKACWSGNSHELVRHRWRTAVSQRSTRYVDESESEWVMHPLVAAFMEAHKHDPVDFVIDLGDEKCPTDSSSITPQLMAIKAACSRTYIGLVKALEPWLVAKGVDKGTARKQARGAARGLLGNALETEVMFSASVAQWLHVLSMRAADAADAEIRLGFAMAALPELKRSRYGDRFAHLELVPASDGIGMSLKGGGAK